jgi:hypothetical protein
MVTIFSCAILLIQTQAVSTNCATYTPRWLMPQFLHPNPGKRHWAAPPYIMGRPFRNNWLRAVTACGEHTLNCVGFHCEATTATKPYIQKNVTCKHCLKIIEKEIH